MSDEVAYVEKGKIFLKDEVDEEKDEGECEDKFVEWDSAKILEDLGREEEEEEEEERPKK